jgi:hypothetical protein
VTQGARVDGQMGTELRRYGSNQRHGLYHHGAVGKSLFLQFRMKPGLALWVSFILSLQGCLQKCATCATVRGLLSKGLRLGLLFFNSHLKMNKRTTFPFFTGDTNYEACPVNPASQPPPCPLLLLW